jgi:hypothetical protein
MLTKPPLSAGRPTGSIVRPINGVLSNDCALKEFLAILGSLTENTAKATGYSPPDIAEWAGTTLIKWAEQDRAEMRELTRPRTVA